MKNNLSPFIVILVLLLGLPTQSINAQKIMVLEDAFVQGGENSNDVMVNTQPKALKVFNSKADSKYARITYLKFKLPKRIKNIKTTKLHFKIKVYNKKNDDRKFKLDVYTVNSNAWNESEITWNSKPEVGEIVGTISLKKSEDKKHRWKEIDLSTEAIIKYVKSNKTNVISLALMNNEFNKTSCAIASKESSKKVAAYLSLE